MRVAASLLPALLLVTSVAHAEGLNSEETRDSSREIGAAMMLATLPIE